MKHSQSGFTFLELVVAMAMVAILASIAMPFIEGYKQKGKIGRTAAEMRSFMSGFYAYLAEFGDWPPDSHMTLPAGMEKYISPEIWATETPLGGNYNWEGPSNGYIGLALFQQTAPIQDIITLDELVDDGNPVTGEFRISDKGRPCWYFDQP